MEYKFSAATTEQIFAFLKLNFDFDFKKESSMLNTTDALVYLGQIPNEINVETEEVISYLKGLHFDILTDKKLNITKEITQYFPINPKHKFKKKIKQNDKNRNNKRTIENS